MAHPRARAGRRLSLLRAACGRGTRPHGLCPQSRRRARRSLRRRPRSQAFGTGRYAAPRPAVGRRPRRRRTGGGSPGIWNLPNPRNRLRIAALLFLVMAGYYWKLTLTRQFEWMTGPDLAEQVLPWFAVRPREWPAGRFPLWDPYLWAGQPLFGQAQPGAAYPLNWILFL